MGDYEKFEHHPLTANQVADTARIVGERYPVYELLAYFLPYSGLRKPECAGLELRDLEFTTRPGESVRCVVQVRRTKDRKGGEWVTSTPKSRKSRRSVPLPSWLAERMRAYVADQTRAHDPTAPLWPSRKNGGYRVPGKAAVVELDWSQPPELGTWFETILAPALVQAGLTVSRPARDGKAAVRGVRLHDYSRHTFATMQLSAGIHFMQVSKWLGHGTFTLTLHTYGDRVPEEDGGAVNNLPEPSRTPDCRPESGDGHADVIELRR